VDGVTGILIREPGVEPLAAAIDWLRRSPLRLEWMGAWARLYAENRRSLASMALSFYRAMRAVGLAEQVGLPRKLRFTASKPPRPAAITPGEVSGNGPIAHTLGPLEGPYEPLQLVSYRWALGPKSRIEYRVEKEGETLLVMRYRNPHAGQQLQVWVNDTRVDERPLRRTGYEIGSIYSARLPLRAGRNEVELRFSEWLKDGSDPRPLAVLLEWVEFLPVP
jgi:hypothetical protein